jgi:hypothetical protein
MMLDALDRGKEGAFTWNPVDVAAKSQDQPSQSLLVITMFMQQCE